MTDYSGTISVPTTGYYLDEWAVRTQERRKSDNKILPSSSTTPASDGTYTLTSPDIYDRYVKLIPEQPKGSDWQASTAYSLGDYVHPTTFSGYVFRCTTAGTSGGTEPTWDETHGNTTSDNTVTWTAVTYLGEDSAQGKFWQGEYEADGFLTESDAGGAWSFEPGNLFQDIYGRTPVTADGDPVALAVDVSGKFLNLKQSTSARRPLYRTDGTLHWLEFDGTDDFLGAELGTTLMDNGGFMGASFDPDDAEALGGVIEEVRSGDDTSRVAIYADTRSTPNRHSLYSPQSTANYADHSAEQPPDPVALTLDSDGSTATGYKNGSSVDTATASDNFSSNTEVNIGVQKSASFYLTGKIYRAVIVGSQRTSAQRTLADQWLADGAGL